MDEREEDDDEEAWLQLRPVEPLPSQCCGSGCSPCVFDLYHRDLARWEAARASKDRGLLKGKESQSCPSELNPETFLAFRISAMDRLTKDTYRVQFALPGNSQLSLRPGQHLILRGTVDDLEIQRAYTPISPANTRGYFEVLIKCYQTGLMSRCVESWRAGDTAFWRGPFGGFFYKPNQVSDNTLGPQETPPSLGSRPAVSGFKLSVRTVPFFLSPNLIPRVSLGLDMGGDGVGTRKQNCLLMLQNYPWVLIA